MAIKGKHSKVNKSVFLFNRSFILTLCAVSLIVIGYLVAGYFFGGI